MWDKQRGKEMKKLIAFVLGLLFSVPAMALPSGYTELEYIQTTGTQYIDTGITATGSIGFESEVSANTYGQELGLIATSNAASGPHYVLQAHSGGLKLYLESALAVTFTSDNDMHHISFNTDGNKKAYTDGVQVTNSYTGSLSQINQTFYLFARNVGGSFKSGSAGQFTCKYFKIYRDGTLIAHFVPVKNSSNVIGMYNILDNNPETAFYGNAGTGSFTGGDPVNTCPAGQVLQTYTSATGTVTQNGTPTPTNPIEPTFYTQGQMELRKINDTYYDSYDATTGKITRRVGVITFNGSESWTLGGTEGNRGVYRSFTELVGTFGTAAAVSTHFTYAGSSLNIVDMPTNSFSLYSNGNMSFKSANTTSVDGFKTWLSSHPVTIYYPLATPVEENWAPEYCVAPIKIATVKYNNAAFSDVVTGLNTAISTIKTVVANTISQTAAVAALQTNKQQKPADADCPAGKKCLLVEDSNGTPHWYEIVESYYNPTLPVGYTELAYLQGDGNSYIDTGYKPSNNTKIDITISFASIANGHIFGSRMTNTGGGGFAVATISNVFAFDYNGNRVSGISPTVGTVYRIVKNGAENQISYGTTVNTYSNSASTFSVDATMALFGINTAGTITSSAASIKIYSAKIWNDGTLVRDFVPARRESDGVLGMYDLANGQFYTNAGTGTFTAGPVVLPAGYTTLQYIESTADTDGRGTSWIDTGIKTNGTDRFVSEWHSMSATNNYVIYGGSNGAIADGERALFWKTTALDVATPQTANTGAYKRYDGLWAANQDYFIDDNISTITVNERTITKDYPVATAFESVYNFMIMGMKRGEELFAFNGVNRMKYFKWYRNGSLFHYYVPARRSSDNAVGVYDLATGDFLQSASGTAFTAGPVAQ